MVSSFARPADESPSINDHAAAKRSSKALIASKTPRPTYVTSSTRVKTLDILSRRSGGGVFGNYRRPFADSGCRFLGRNEESSVASSEGAPCSSQDLNSPIE